MKVYIYICFSNLKRQIIKETYRKTLQSEQLVYNFELPSYKLVYEGKVELYSSHR